MCGIGGVWPERRNVNIDCKLCICRAKIGRNISSCVLARVIVHGGKKYASTSSTYDPIDSNSVPVQRIAGFAVERDDAAVEAVGHAAQLAASPVAENAADIFLPVACAADTSPPVAVVEPVSQAVAVGAGVVDAVEVGVVAVVDVIGTDAVDIALLEFPHLPAAQSVLSQLCCTLYQSRYLQGSWI